MTNQGWHDDPKRLAFTLTRYKFVAASLKALEAGDLREFGLLMHEHWEHKKRRSGSMSNNSVDEWYALSRRNGDRRQARRRRRRRFPDVLTWG
jgi:galactokinase/mevalonate kinase-like predicted kinase